MSNDSLLSNSVWDRRYEHEESTMSRQLYLLLICGWTAAGIAFSAVCANVSQGWPVNSWNGWEQLGFALGVLAVSLLGTWIADSSDSTFVSAMGYVLVAGPFGLLLGPYVAMYDTSSVVEALALTSGVVIVLGIVGAVLPDDLSSWGVPLLGGLLLLIFGYFAVPLLSLFGIPTHGALTVLDWAALLIFGALVIFDLNRAVRLAYTANNAVDCAVAVYLDFINIFIRILSLLGNEKS